MSKITSRKNTIQPDPTGLAGRRVDEGYETIKSAAERLGVSVSTVREWIVKGRLPSCKLGHGVRLKIEDVDSMLQPRPLLTGNER